MPVPPCVSMREPLDVILRDFPRAMGELAGHDEPLPHSVMQVQSLPVVMLLRVSLPCPIHGDRPALAMPDRLVL